VVIQAADIRFPEGARALVRVRRQDEWGRETVGGGRLLDTMTGGGAHVLNENPLSLPVFQHA
jgi:hypothetical protein